MVDNPKSQPEFTEEEIDARRDAMARRVMNTPPKPRKKRIPDEVMLAFSRAAIIPKRPLREIIDG